MKVNEPDGANRRQPFGFREWVGVAGVVGFTAAVAHLECWPLSARLGRDKGVTS